jgi:hypothetical protein
MSLIEVRADYQCAAGIDAMNDWAEMRNSAMQFVV